MRIIEIKITLDDQDSEALEICAGAMTRTPDEILSDLLGEAIKVQLKKFLEEARRVSDRELNPIQRVALQARGLVHEKWTKMGAEKK
jgi:hypothetical protein